MADVDDGPDGDFERWYRREHPRVVAALAVAGGDVDVAREATDEAFVRAYERWARVRVIPNNKQYLIDVKVYKELEDLLEPEHSTISGQVNRHDNSLDYDRRTRLPSPPNKGWIPMGRDFALEQTILTNIQQRISAVIQADPGCVR